MKHNWTETPFALCFIEKTNEKYQSVFHGWNGEFDDYYASVKRRKTRRTLKFIHLRSWIQFVVSGYNYTIRNNNNFE